MKELLLCMAQYNAWANEPFIQLLLTLGDEIIDKEIVSSFPSIRKTALHIWGAEDIWLQRFEGMEKPVWKPATFNGTIGEACDAWRSASAALIRFTENTNGDELSRIVTAINMRGESIADALHSGLQHVFNHSTYHRGQLVTMLRQAGVSAIPGTDLIAYARGLCETIKRA
jgi:uncharacterized damage-inducible protein DinB